MEEEKKKEEEKKEEKKKSQPSKLPSKQEIVELVQTLAQQQLQLTERVKTLEETLSKLTELISQSAQSTEGGLNPFWATVIQKALFEEKENPLLKSIVEASFKSWLAHLKRKDIFEKLSERIMLKLAEKVLSKEALKELLEEE